MQRNPPDPAIKLVPKLRAKILGSWRYAMAGPFHKPLITPTSHHSKWLCRSESNSRHFQLFLLNLELPIFDRQLFLEGATAKRMFPLYSPGTHEWFHHSNTVTMPPTQLLTPARPLGVLVGTKSPKHIKHTQFTVIPFSFFILVVNGSMPWTMAPEFSGTGTDDYWHHKNSPLNAEELSSIWKGLLPSRGPIWSTEGREHPTSRQAKSTLADVTVMLSSYFSLW